MITPLSPRPEVLDFLLNRRSRPSKTLTGPAPDRAALAPLLEAALRVPDHGKLEPWRLVVLTRGALDRLADAVLLRGAALGIDPQKVEKAAGEYANSPLAVMVVSAPKPSEKVPQIEQVYSAGAVCLSLVNAALAAGWGANWLSGWASHDAVFRTQDLGLSGDERVAGLIHLGTETTLPPERPRPDLSQAVTWVEA